MQAVDGGVDHSGICILVCVLATSALKVLSEAVPVSGLGECYMFAHRGGYDVIAYLHK